MRALLLRLIDGIRSGIKRIRLETTVLTSLCIAIGCAWIFVEVADEVLESENHRFDRELLLALRRGDDPSQPIGPHWLPEAARDLTALGSYSVITLVCLGALGFLALRRKWDAFWLVYVSVVGGAMVNSLLKRMFDRVRPDVVPHLTAVDSLSFPSGHSMLAAVTYFTLASLLAQTAKERLVKAYFLAIGGTLAILVGLTRLYLGVHYPSDVLAGWCAGITWALFCSLLANWLRKKGAIEP